MRYVEEKKKSTTTTGNCSRARPSCDEVPKTSQSIRDLRGWGRGHSAVSLERAAYTRFPSTPPAGVPAYAAGRERRVAVAPPPGVQGHRMPHRLRQRHARLMAHLSWCGSYRRTCGERAAPSPTAGARRGQEWAQTSEGQSTRQVPHAQKENIEHLWALPPTVPTHEPAPTRAPRSSSRNPLPPLRQYVPTVDHGVSQDHLPHSRRGGSGGCRHPHYHPPRRRRSDADRRRGAPRYPG